MRREGVALPGGGGEKEGAGALAVLQARMSSTRLPGKVLRLLAGRPVLWHCLQGISRSSEIGRIVVACSEGEADDPIESFCRDNGTHCVRGSEEDVLSRFLLTASLHPGDPIVRLSADSPLLDGAVIDRTIRAFREARADYATPYLSGACPLGLGAEVMSREALLRAGREGRAPHHREHVTPYLYEEEGRFRVLSVPHPEGLAHWRLCIDTPEDLALFEKLFEALFAGPGGISVERLAEYLSDHPDLSEINSGVRQRSFRSSIP